jgi:hypothetical protein
LADIPVEKVIPTPPPGPPPPPPAMPGSQGCPPSPAMVSVSNRGNAALIIMLQGAQMYMVDLSPGQTKNVCLARGPYQYTATTTNKGAVPEQGAQLFAGVSPVCWSLPAAAGAAPPCNAPADPGAYTSPMGGELPPGAGLK